MMATADAHRAGPATPPRRAWLAAGAATVAGSAYYGAAGLVTGYLGIGDELTGRLPLASPVLGGLALAALVGGPFTLLAVLAARGDERSGALAVACGIGLVAWIAVELAVLREVSFLHPLCGVTGLAFAVAGRRASPRVAPVRGRPSDVGTA